MFFSLSPYLPLFTTSPQQQHSFILPSVVLFFQNSLSNYWFVPLYFIVFLSNSCSQLSFFFLFFSVGFCYFPKQLRYCSFYHYCVSVITLLPFFVVALYLLLAVVPLWQSFLCRHRRSIAVEPSCPFCCRRSFVVVVPLLKSQFHRQLVTCAIREKCLVINSIALHNMRYWDLWHIMTLNIQEVWISGTR
jgi:hypothetical protein